MGGNLLKEQKTENAISKTCYILALVLLVVSVISSLMSIVSSQISTTLAFAAFTIYFIPSILKNEKSGWICGILGLLLIILNFIPSPW